MSVSISMSASSLVAQVVKNLPCNAREPRDAGSIPGSGGSPGGGQTKPIVVIISQYM